jgi:hypothetical protein
VIEIRVTARDRGNLAVAPDPAGRECDSRSAPYLKSGLANNPIRGRRRGYPRFVPDPLNENGHTAK